MKAFLSIFVNSLSFIIQVDSHSERFIKARGDVQRMIEDVKKNSIGVKDVVRRYFRELRATIDSTEKTLVEKLSSRSEVNLKALREQLRWVLMGNSAFLNVMHQNLRVSGIFRVEDFFTVIGFNKLSRTLD